MLSLVTQQHPPKDRSVGAMEVKLNGTVSPTHEHQRAMWAAKQSTVAREHAILVVQSTSTQQTFQASFIFPRALMPMAMFWSHAAQIKLLGLYATGTDRVYLPVGMMRYICKLVKFAV
jgi:hypothetical protein